MFVSEISAIVVSGVLHLVKCYSASCWVCHPRFCGRRYIMSSSQFR